MDRIANIKERVIGYLTSPTIVWLGSLYISSLISMVGFSVARAGFTLDGLFGGPQYYVRLFFNYGLNGIQGKYTSPFASGLLAWLIAPFVVVYFGAALAVLSEGGWSVSIEQSSNDLGTKGYAYFNDDPFGYSVVIFGDKFNLFYIGVVWMPVIVASVMTYLYKRHTKKSSNPVSMFFTSALIIFPITYEFSKITDPNVHIVWSELLPTLIVHRHFNTFIEYNGHYHPTSTAVFLMIIVIMLMAIDLLVNSTIIGTIKYRESRELRRRMKEEQREEMEGETKLPWEYEEATS